MATEQLPDSLAIRSARRSRLFAAMEAHDLDILVLGRVANIRYASGVPILWNAGTRPFGPGCVVVRSTEEMFVLSTWDEGVPDDIPHDHLFGITWNPMNMVKMLQDVGTRAQPARWEPMPCRPCSQICCRWHFPTQKLSTPGQRYEIRDASRHQRRSTRFVPLWRSPTARSRRR